MEFLFHNFCFSVMNGDYGLWEIHKHAVDKDKLSDKNYLRMLATASRSASSIIQIQYFSGMLEQAGVGKEILRHVMVENAARAIAIQAV